MALEASGIGYHGKVKEITRISENSDYMLVTISPEGVRNPQDKTYTVMDIFFQTTADKICEKIVYVRESTTGELLKLLKDNYMEQNDVIKKPEILFRYDPQALSIYSHVSLRPIKNSLRENVKKYLNTPENRLYILNLLSKTPSYIGQYGCFDKFKKRLDKDANYQFTMYDSEHIHFYCSAYDAALQILKGKHTKNTHEEIGIIDHNYTRYLDKVVDDNLTIGYDTFQGYIDVFKAEIVHNAKGHTTSIREQHTLNMYNSLPPSIKYYFFTENINLPVSQITYNYLVAVYHMQHVYQSYKSSKNFDEILEKLMRLYHTTYPYGLPTQKRDDNNILLFDADLHEHDVFNQDVGAQVLLSEIFDYLAEELYETFQENIQNPDKKTSYVDMLDRTIRERLNNDTLNVQRFYYCLQILEQIHYTSLANKE